MFHSRTLACLTVTLAFVCLAGGSGETQGLRRQGGPLDWSHGRIAESRRPNRERSLSRNWRSYRKQLRMDAARGDAIRAGSLAAVEIQPPPPTGLRIVTSSPAPTMPSGPRPAPLPATAELDWNLSTGGYGAVVGYPAKYNFDIGASNCADVMYFTVDHAGTASAVNVIAITNSYGHCPGNSTGKTPTVKFGLRLTSGTATSPVPSLDGETLYVIESRRDAA